MQPTVTSEPDGQLLEEYVRTQNPVAFDQLARRYRGMVFSVARRVTQSHHDAEDVAQSCFLELARKASSIRISIPAFLHATATRRSIDVLRDQTRRRKHEKKAAADPSKLIAEENPLERSWDEISPEVDEAIENLPDELRTLVILYFLRGLSVSDISAETGINRGTVERRLQVGIRRLRAGLSKGTRVVAAGVLVIGFKASSALAVPASLTASTGRMALATALNVPQAWSDLPTGRLSILRNLSIVASVVLVAIGLGAIGRFHLRSGAGATDPYDQMQQLYGRNLPVSDVSGFFLHAAQMKTDVSSFWRGSQPLFYRWCKSNCQDWLGQPDAYTLCQASPNLEDAQNVGEFVNCDDSARLPIQIELLQGMIISRLATDRSLQGASNQTVVELAKVICESFRKSLSKKTELEAGSDVGGKWSGISRYLNAEGNFKNVILSEQNKVQEFLRPSPVEVDKVEKMVGDAIVHNSALGRFCGSEHPIVEAVRASVRPGSVVAQGQLLLVVQLKGVKPLLQIKEQTAASAELAGAIARERRCPGERAAEDALDLCELSGPIGWCKSGEMSFTVAPVDSQPQVYELRKDRWLNPVDAGRIWADGAGWTHRNVGNRERLAALITPALEAQLVVRSDAYLKQLELQMENFINDPRVAQDRGSEDALTAGWLGQMSIPRMQ